MPNRAMPRFKLTLEYDGGPFAGWQRQANAPSVQAAVERALRALEPQVSGITGAGRTDAGVHALGQVAHCDLARDWDPFRLAEALNHHLRPDPVAILDVVPVPDDFHARFSAVERRYLYRILPRRAPAVLERGRVWQVRTPLDPEPMRAAARLLTGQHDFTTFRSAHCQALSPVKTLDSFEVREAGDEIHLHLAARSFLHNQVRSLAGTLERVGAGRWAPADARAALEARDRAACGPVAPPEGLYLVSVRYP